MTEDIPGIAKETLLKLKSNDTRDRGRVVSIALALTAIFMMSSFNLLLLNMASQEIRETTILTKGIQNQISQEVRGEAFVIGVFEEEVYVIPFASREIALHALANDQLGEVKVIDQICDIDPTLWKGAIILVGSIVSVEELKGG